MRQDIEGDAVGIHLVFRIAGVEKVAHLAFQLLNAFLACAGHGLIGGNHHAVDVCRVVQGLEHHYHLDGGTVGIGNDALMLFQGLRIDFRHHQGTALVHAPGRGIVHHHATGMGGVRRELRGCAAAGGKDGQVDAVKDIFLQLFHREFLLAEGHFAAR